MDPSSASASGVSNDLLPHLVLLRYKRLPISHFRGINTEVWNRVIEAMLPLLVGQPVVGRLNKLVLAIDAPDREYQLALDGGHHVQSHDAACSFRKHLAARVRRNIY